jgi:hypothetical protein
MNKELWKKSPENKSHGRPGYKWKDTIKTKLKEFLGRCELD